MAKTRFERLLEPLQIGRVKTRNRMVKAPQGMGLCTEDGQMTGDEIGAYETLAKGGVGLIITGIAAVDFPLGVPHRRRLAIHDDKLIPAFRELADRVHKYGCPIFVQLNHAGAAHLSSISGLQPISSSPLTGSELQRPHYNPPRGLTVAEIEDLIDKYIKAGERAQKAGFDGIELHAAHNYLLNSFLSPAWNKRQDQYGGELKNRFRLPGEIIKALKQRLGRDYPVGIRINGAEYGVTKGTSPEDGREIARMLQEAGADHISVSAYGYGPYWRLPEPEQVFYPEPPEPFPESLDRRYNGSGALVPLAAGIKHLVSIPVITAGGLDSIMAERILREGKADLVAFGRALVADPELPNKVASGRLEDIRPCMRCQNCWERVVNRVEPARCRVNATVGREGEKTLEPAKKKRKIMVVGSGPAGMEAARVAALRGHEVLLYDKQQKLGGLLPLAALIKGVEIENLPSLVRYYSNQMRKLGVKVNLGQEVNLALVEQIKPDVIILATGGIPTVPEVTGINGRNVVKASDMHRMLKFYLRFLNPSTIRWLTKFWMPIGKRVVIMGGGMHGCELGEFLVKRGRKVTIVETSDKLGDEMVTDTKVSLLRWFATKEVPMLTGVKYEGITDKGLTITTKEGVRQTIEVDTILPAMSLKPNTGLFKILEGKAPEIHLIGDCREPHLILEAIDDGFSVGNAV